MNQIGAASMWILNKSWTQAFRSIMKCFNYSFITSSIVQVSNYDSQVVFGPGSHLIQSSHVGLQHLPANVSLPWVRGEQTLGGRCYDPVATVTTSPKGCIGKVPSTAVFSHRGPGSIHSWCFSLQQQASVPFFSPCHQEDRHWLWTGDTGLYLPLK